MGEGNVVLSYKPQGASDDKTGLQTDDFIIVLQTPVQAELLKNSEEKLFVLMQHMVLMLTSSN